jgi:hypothetical protein
MAQGVKGESRGKSDVEEGERRVLGVKRTKIHYIFIMYDDSITKPTR